MLFLVGSVSASEQSDNLQVANETDTVSTGGDAVMSVSDSSEVLGDAGTFTALQDKIDTAIANGQSEITLENDYTYNSDFGKTTGIEITGSITINGNYKKIDGLNASRIFYIKSNLITFKNLNFINGKANVGGAIYFPETYSNLTINNCNFTYCNTTGYGGAIYAGGANGTITYCNFDHDITGSNGGGINVRNENYTIKNCNFTNCYSTTSGAGLNFNTAACGFSLVKDCYFAFNHAHVHSGAIETYSKNSSFINCTFVNNTADQNGGAFILLSGAPFTSLIDCKFYNNSAMNGGAIFCNNANCYNTTIYNCTFDNNNATTGHGGAFYFNARYANVSNSNFTNNYATRYGGAVYSNAADSIVDNCLFENNVASDGNNFYATAGNTITITNCGFDEFYVSDTGTGDGLRHGSPTSFTSAINSIEAGGKIYFIGTFTNLYGKTIDKSVNILGYEDAAVINLQDKSARAFTITADDVVIKGITFQNSLITGDGGVLLWNGDNGTVSECSFINNQAANGGAIYWNGADGSVIDSTFERNTATSNGGAITWVGSSGSVDNCEFSQNQAITGTSIFIAMQDSDDTQFELKDCTFTGDSGTNGVVAAKELDELHLGGNTFSGCTITTATYDEYYYFSGDISPTITSAIVYVSPTGSDTASGLTEDHATSWSHAYNDVVEDGGKIILLSGDYTFSQTIQNKQLTIVGTSGARITGKRSSVAFDIKNSDIVFDNVNFDGLSSNSATVYPIKSDRNSDVEFDNCTFKNCGDSNTDVLIYIEQGTGRFVDSNFTSNTVNLDLVWITGGNVDFTNCLIKDNTGVEDGAILYDEGAQGTISGSTFNNNGYNIVSDSSTVSLTNNVFQGVAVTLNSINTVSYGSNVGVTGTFNANVGDFSFSGIPISVSGSEVTTASVSSAKSLTASWATPLPEYYTLTLGDEDTNGNKFVYTSGSTTSVSVYVKASDIYISKNGDGSGVDAAHPTTWDNVANRLSDTGTVHFADDTYTLSGKSINKGWTLTGSSANNVIIDGNGQANIFSIDATGVTIDKLTLQNAVKPITGENTVTVTNSVLKDQLSLDAFNTPYKYGDAVTISGSFSPISVSSLTVKNGETEIGSASITGSSYTLTTTTLGVGSYAVTTNKTQKSEA